MVDFYVAPNLKKTLSKMRNAISKGDDDRVVIVDGPEGAGKSVFSFQLASEVDPTFDLSRVCMTPEEFKKAIERAKKHQAIVYDEAYNGLSSRASLSAVNKLLVGKMMEMRQKNLFVLIVLPSFFLLDRYVALFRSDALFHIYKNKGVRGYWIGFNRKNKKLLYIQGRKLMSYSKPYIQDFKGRFYGVYTVDEEGYRKKKLEALENSGEARSPDTRFQIQRNLLIKYILETEGLSYRKAADKFKEIGFERDLALSMSQIYKISANVAKMSPVSRFNI